MIVSGWRCGADKIAAISAVRKHTGMSLQDSMRLIDDIIDGKPRRLPDDFVLREELETLNFIVE